MGLIVVVAEVCTLLPAVAADITAAAVEASITPRPGPAATVMALMHRIHPAVPGLADRGVQDPARIPARGLERADRAADSMAARRDPTRDLQLQMANGIRSEVRPIPRGQPGLQ